MSKISEALYATQIPAAQGLARALATKGAALDLSDTGIGKTFHALGAIDLVSAPKFCVVCRAVAKQKWVDTIKEMGMSGQCLAVDSWNRYRSGSIPELVFRERKHNRVSRKRPEKAAFSWRPSSAFAAQLVVIFDEIQDASGEKSANSELVIAAVRSPHCFPLGLSASVAGDPLKMYALGFMTRMHNGTDFHDWCYVNNCRKAHFGGLYFRKCGKPKEHARGCDCGHRHTIGAMHRHLIPGYGVRVTYEEAKVSMPPERISVELWEVPKTLPKSLAHLEKELRQAEDKDLEKADEGLQIGALINIRERQFAELYRMPALAEEIIESVRSGYKCPVFLSHSRSVDALKILLDAEEIKCGILDGRDKKRATASLQAFQVKRSIDVLISQSAAGSASIDMHDEIGDAPRHAYHSPNYNAEIMIQALGRAYRRNAKSPVLQRICFAEDTVEEEVFKVAQAHVSRIRSIMDGTWERAWA